MKKIKRILTPLALALGVGLASFAIPAHAQDALQPETQNGVTYVSGGIGDGGIEAIQAAKKHYDLHLLFAVERSGQYLADIQVSIENAKGDVVVKTVAGGPFFLAQLAPGKYRVTASNQGSSQTKSVVIRAGLPSELSFYWPAAS